MLDRPWHMVWLAAVLAHAVGSARARISTTIRAGMRSGIRTHHAGDTCAAARRITVLLLLGATSAAQGTEALTLAEAQRIAENRAPQLTAAHAQESAARDMAAAAGQLPPPVLKFGVNNVPVSGEMAWSLTRDGMTMRQIGLMQELTRGGKRQAQVERALGEAGLAQAARRQALADARRDSALAWLDLSYLESMRQLVSAQLDELRLQQQATEAAFRSGRGPQADMLANELATARTRDQLAQMQRDIAMARIRLARWIGDEAQRPVASPPAAQGLNWQTDGRDDGLDAHPALATQLGMVNLAEAEARLARERRTPDMAIEVMYSQRGSDYADMVSVNISLPLPWDRANRQDRELAASLARVDAARAAREDMHRAYRAEVRERFAAWQADRERLARYDAELVPLAAAQVDAALAAYRAGTGMLDRVLEARRMQLDTRMERQRVALEAARGWAQINFLNPQDGNSAVDGAQP
ncbi:MAG: TolC family protein [Moraxellaceae bacterium]|nr:TolC family protein [Moraxellaceae bacterium]